MNPCGARRCATRKRRHRATPFRDMDLRVAPEFPEKSGSRVNSWRPQALSCGAVTKARRGRSLAIPRCLPKTTNAVCTKPSIFETVKRLAPMAHPVGFVSRNTGRPVQCPTVSETHPASRWVRFAKHRSPVPVPHGEQTHGKYPLGSFRKTPVARSSAPTLRGHWANHVGFVSQNTGRPFQCPTASRLTVKPVGFVSHIPIAQPCAPM